VKPCELKPGTCAYCGDGDHNGDAEQLKLCHGQALAELREKEFRWSKMRERISELEAKPSDSHSVLIAEIVDLKAQRDEWERKSRSNAGAFLEANAERVALKAKLDEAHQRLIDGKQLVITHDAVMAIGWQTRAERAEAALEAKTKEADELRAELVKVTDNNAKFNQMATDVFNKVKAERDAARAALEAAEESAYQSHIINEQAIGRVVAERDAARAALAESEAKSNRLMAEAMESSSGQCPDCQFPVYGPFPVCPECQEGRLEAAKQALAAESLARREAVKHIHEQDERYSKLQDARYAERKSHSEALERERGAKAKKLMEARDILKEIVAAVKTEPIMNNHKYDGIGHKTVRFIAELDRIVSDPTPQEEPKP
jgi:DNA repair exonuclease SbcCD ATPase subunit